MLLLATTAEFVLPDRRQRLAPLDAALLAWLVLEGPTSRARLATLLWPLKEADAARNSLRQRLFQLRREVGFDVVDGQATLRLADGIAHDLADADQVLGGLPAGQLPGGEFAQWLQQQRTRRHERVRASLAELADMAERARDWPDALAHARELLALAPDSEEAHRRVMRLHYLRGDRAAALLAFDACERMLKDEVGARPSAETLALLAAVEAEAQRSALPAPAPLPAGVLRPPRLVGRVRETAALQAAWQAAHVAALIGEAGLGKTRLLQDFAAAHPGVLVAAGRPGDAGVPLSTLARLLRAALDAAPAAPALPAPTRREIARVLPETAPGAVPAAGEGQRLVLLHAVAELLARCVPPVTVVLDDLHFADAASLDLVAGLIDAEGGAVALRWVLAWRPAAADSPVAALHDRLVEQARLVPVGLAPLDAPALAELVDSLGLPGLRGDALAEPLLRRTGGNPLFVLETLKQAWVEQGLDALAAPRTAGGSPVLPRAASVARLVERRLAQLSPGALALARVAAIAGVDFSIELAENVLQAGALQFADALVELEAAQVLRGTAFAHDLVHDAVRDGVPKPIAALTHARVAAWLEPRGAAPARIAQHWRAAGRDAQALPWLARAADAAERALRPPEAIAFREAQSRIEEQCGDRTAAFASQLAALHTFVQSDNDRTGSVERLERLDRLATTDAERVEALLARATSLLVRGEVAPAIVPAETALRLALAAGDAARGGALLARVRRLLGACLGQVDRTEEAARHLEAALVWIDAHAEAGERGEAHADLAVVLDNLGRLDDAWLQHQQAQALCLQAGRLADASVACGNLACNRIDAGDLQAADEALQRGQQLVAALDGAAAHQGVLHVLRTLTLAHLGRYREALAQSELATAAIDRQQPGFVWRARMREAQLWWHLGQWQRLAALLDGLPSDDELPHALRAQRVLLRRQAVHAGHGGRAARGAATQALHATLEALHHARRPDLTLPLRIEAARGLPPGDAAQRLQEVRREAAAIGHRGTVLAAWLHAAAAQRESDPAAAAAAAREALALADAGCVSTALLPAERWLHAGLALRAAGDPRGSAVLADGARWLQETAARRVPAPFRDSFLHRQPPHAALRDAVR